MLMPQRRWTVVWVEEAEQQLAALWLDEVPLKRPLLSQSADQLERFLATEPEQNARPVLEPPDRFVRVHGSLVVVFEIKADDRLVRVLDVYKSKAE